MSAPDSDTRLGKGAQVSRRLQGTVCECRRHRLQCSQVTVYRPLEQQIHSIRAMALKVLLEQEKAFFTIVVLLASLACKVMCETGDCRQQEFQDRSGNCVLCKQCGPGMELSKECGFGYGEDAQCVTCRPHRFKEDWGFQKCKPCLDCAVVNRFQKANCSVTSDAVCGDCLPGFYRKTKLVGFQDMECVPCGDPPPPYEPHWSLRGPDIRYNGSELSCLDRPRLGEPASRACCQCHQDSAQPCGPVHLIPSLCCDEACSTSHVTLGCGAHSQAALQERNAGPVRETAPAGFGPLSRSVCGEFSDAWPLVQNPPGDDGSSCGSCPELAGEDAHSLSPESESLASWDSRSAPDSDGATLPVRAHSENVTETPDFPGQGSALTEPVPTHSGHAGSEKPARSRGRPRP
ncbi:tumor necrosis factor receptor superfamily member 19 isoform X3 [Manis pentadactyla]|uniref:tumor necrosis factor receptor superfamily member 19 isoform X3 n=1 Tax=Manis pentadactyla TaxID=143292 RepID=UPI00255C5C1C|nr:tumor necrosis factor receptor superfamily member 19 isoform X3 [Manis pentadactyla]